MSCTGDVATLVYKANEISEIWEPVKVVVAAGCFKAFVILFQYVYVYICLVFVSA
jgi:hypothetical protein